MNIQGNYYLQDKKKIKREIELSIRAKYLKELRTKIKKTQKEVAEQIGISQSYISRLEKKIIKKLRVKLESIS